MWTEVRDPDLISLPKVESVIQNPAGDVKNQGGKDLIGFEFTRMAGFLLVLGPGSEMITFGSLFKWLNACGYVFGFINQD